MNVLKGYLGEWREFKKGESLQKIDSLVDRFSLNFIKRYILLRPVKKEDIDYFQSVEDVTVHWLFDLSVRGGFPYTLSPVRWVGVLEISSNVKIADIEHLYYSTGSIPIGKIVVSVSDAFLDIVKGVYLDYLDGNLSSFDVYNKIFQIGGKLIYEIDPLQDYEEGEHIGEEKYYFDDFTLLEVSDFFDNEKILDASKLWD